MKFTIEQMRCARRADLHGFLIKRHPGAHKIEGNSIHPKNNHSLSIKRGYTGYNDFATGETGNAVDYLTKYMGYSLPGAVNALCDYMGNNSSFNNDTVNESNTVISAGKSYDNISDVAISEQKGIIPPEAINGPYRQLFAYLMGRKIPAPVIKALINDGLLYQAVDHNNIVFINKDRDFVEIHGSLSFGRAYHRVRRTSKDRFWSFSSKTVKTVPTETIDTAYICEAAIDAISLFVLNSIKPDNHPAYYISIAGVANQATIDRIKHMPAITNVILAVDNDIAGDKCRERNSDINYIVPEHKDWNEDLMAG